MAWDKCALEEVSDHSAAMNRSISSYLWEDVPTQEIESNIIWLNKQLQNIDHQIHRLKQIKTDRDRVRKWREDMNNIAQQFYDEDSLHLDLETRAKIIQQRLGCEWHRAYFLADKIQKWVKNKMRNDRDKNICHEYARGTSATKLAKKHQISRQQIYNIVKKEKNLL